MDYKIVPIGGKSGSIPMLDAYQDKSKSENLPTPTWIIKADTYFTSQMQGFEEYIPLQGLSMHSSNDAELSFGSTRSLASSASLRHSEVIFAVENGEYGPDLETHMNENKVLKQVTIVRLTTLNKKISPIQTLIFDDCFIKKIQQEFDRLFVWVRISKRTNKYSQYSRDGSARGSSVSQIDYTQSTLPS